MLCPATRWAAASPSYPDARLETVRPVSGAGRAQPDFGVVEITGPLTDSAPRTFIGLRAGIIAALAVAVGCGTTESSGKVGDTLSAKGLEVTVQEVDTSVPVPKIDVTGLSRPAPGKQLVGARVHVCSTHGGATGPYDFGVETTSGDHGGLKYPERNYDQSFESLRDGCGGGWVVFEIPAGSEPDRVTFGFEDTGSAPQPQSQVDARFSWDIA